MMYESQWTVLPMCQVKDAIQVLAPFDNEQIMPCQKSYSTSWNRLTHDLSPNVWWTSQGLASMLILSSKERAQTCDSVSCQVSDESWGYNIQDGTITLVFSWFLVIASILHWACAIAAIVLPLLGGQSLDPLSLSLSEYNLLVHG